MPDTETNDVAPADCCDRQAEIDRLNRVVKSLMERAERDTGAQMSDFGKFQSTVLLEQQVRERTVALEAALHENEQITRELRDSTRELVDSEQRFRTLVQHSTDLTMILDDQLVVRYATPASESILGRSPAELLGHNVADFAHPEDLAKTIDDVAHGAPMTHLSGRVQARWRHADGSWRVVESIYTDR